MAKLSRRIGIFGVVLITALLGFASPSLAATAFAPYGNASVNADGSIIVVSDNSANPPYGGASFSIPSSGITLGQISYLGAQYTANEGTCAGGSPRFTLQTPNGNIFAFFSGTPLSNDCAQSGDTGNLLASTTCDATQIGQGYVACSTLDPSTSITAISLDVDGGWSQTQSFTIFPTVALSNPAGMDQCKNGGYASFGYANQGQCIKFVNTGS